MKPTSLSPTKKTPLKESTPYPHGTPATHPHLSNGIHIDAFVPCGFAFLFLLPLSLQVIVQNWELVPIITAIIILNLLASRYAKRLDINHRFSKMIRNLYFITFGHSETGHPSKLMIRLPILIALPILLVLLGMPIAIGHHRPPLLDTHRYLDWTLNPLDSV